MLKNLAKKLTNNLGLKVLAVLFAIALWIVVVNIDDPVKPAQYTISVTQDNMDYLTSNGKYSETLGGKNTVTFTAYPVLFCSLRCCHTGLCPLPLS